MSANRCPKSVAFLACLALGFVAGARAETKIRLGFSYWLPNAPLDLAESKGWWREAGLEVAIQRFETTQEVVQLLLKGELDLATDMVGTWLDAANRGEPVVLLGETDWSHGGDKLLLAKDADLPALKGGHIAVYIRNLAVLHFLGEHLRAQQMTLSDFAIIEIADEDKLGELFVSGKVRGVVYYEPIVSQLEEKVGARVVATTADYPGVMPEGFAANRNALAGIPHDALVKFFRVWFRAVSYAQDSAHAEEMARIASEMTYAGTETFAAADLAEELAKVPFHTPERAARENSPGGNLENFARKSMATLQRLGSLRPQFDPMRAIDTRALVEAAGGPAPVAAVAQK